MIYYKEKNKQCVENKEHIEMMGSNEQLTVSDFDENITSDYTTGFKLNSQAKKTNIRKIEPFMYKDEKLSKCLRTNLNEYIKDQDSDVEGSFAISEFEKVHSVRKENNVLSTFLSINSEMKEEICVPLMELHNSQPKFSKPFTYVSSLKVPLLKAESQVETITTHSSTNSIVEFDANCFSEINYESIQEDSSYSPLKTLYSRFATNIADKWCNYEQKEIDRSRYLTNINNMGKMLRNIKSYKTTFLWN